MQNEKRECFISAVDLDSFGYTQSNLQRFRSRRSDEPKPTRGKLQYYIGAKKKKTPVEYDTAVGK